MDIGKAFSFVFDDENWIVKLLIGGLIAIIPIVNFAAFGYMVQVVKNVRDGYEPVMPEWSEFGEYFVDGFKVFVGLLAYSIPLILLGCVFGVAIAAAGEMVNSGDVEDVMAILSICFNCVIFVFALIPAIFFPAILVSYAETGEIGPMLRIGDLWSFIQQDIGSYVIVLLLAFVATSFIAPLGLILCLIGVLFTQWWSYLVVAHLTGQLARNNAMIV